MITHSYQEMLTLIEAVKDDKIIKQRSTDRQESWQPFDNLVDSLNFFDFQYKIVEN